MPPRKRYRKASFTRRVPLRVHDAKFRFSGRIDLMQTVYPDACCRPSLSLSIVPEEDEEAISVLSVVVPTMEGDNTKKRMLAGLVELVIDMALIMQRKVRKSKRAVDQ